MRKFNLDVEKYDIIFLLIPENGSLFIYPINKGCKLDGHIEYFSLGVIENCFQDSYHEIENNERLSDNDFDNLYIDILRKKKKELELFNINNDLKKISMIVLNQDFERL